MELDIADWGEMTGTPGETGRAGRFARVLFPALAGAVICSGLSATPGAASFVVSPMEHHLSVPAGERGTASLSIRNTGDRPLSLRLYLADSHFGRDGREEDVELGTLDRSCAPWIRLESDLLDLEPGQLQQLTIDLSVAAGAEGSFWTKLYIEEMSVPQPVVEERAGRRYQVFMHQRMGIRIFEDVPGTASPGLVVTNVDIDPPTNEDAFVRMSAENTGNALLRCNGWFELRTSRGELVDTLRRGPDGGFVVFPGASRDIAVALPTGLPADTYTVLAIVDYGGESLIAGEQILRMGEVMSGRPIIAEGAP